MEDCKGGFPHSEIAGSKGASASPALIAACHVLHRLSTPRHPSEALQRLIVSQQNSCVVAPPDWKDAGGPRLIFVRQCLLLEQDLEAPIQTRGSRPRSSFTISMPVGERRRAIPDAICEFGGVRHRFQSGASGHSPLGEWWSQTESNRRHPACKAGALPTELWPRSSRNRLSPGELSAILS